MIDLIKYIDAGYGAKEPQQWPVYGGGVLDRTEYVTASEIGYCARKVKFDKAAMKDHMAKHGITAAHGTKNSASIDWGFFERGHGIEAWAVDLLTKGYDGTHGDLMYTGADQVSFVAGCQSGTPDGVFLRDTEFDILEIKSIDPRTNRNKLPKKEHIDQVMQNADLIAENLDLSPSGGYIIYIDASNWKQRHIFRVEFDDAHAARLEQRAELILGATGPDVLKAEGMYTDQCKYCAHTAACSALIRSEKGEMGNDEEYKKASARLFG